MIFSIRKQDLFLNFLDCMDYEYLTKVRKVTASLDLWSDPIVNYESDCNPSTGLGKNKKHN